MDYQGGRTMEGEAEGTELLRILSLGPMACLSSFQSLSCESPVAGIFSSQNLGLFGLIEAVLLF